MSPAKIVVATTMRAPIPGPWVTIEESDETGAVSRYRGEAGDQTVGPGPVQLNRD